jgi:four helix bundle protein
VLVWLLRLLVAEVAMSRDHRKLQVFHEAHALVLAIYQQTQQFPKDEWFGLRLQLRRAAVSVVSNIVEGSARGSARDYLRFLHIALGSACEVKYLAALIVELGYREKLEWFELQKRCDATVKQLVRLVQGVEQKALEDTRRPAEPRGWAR